MGRGVEIVVYVLAEVLEHKKRDGKRSEGRFCYWSLGKRVPRKLFGIGTVDACQDDAVIELEKESKVRLYFATKGFICGFFDVHEISVDLNELRFYSETWTPIKPIPQKPFQGFKYLKGAGS